MTSSHQFDSINFNQLTNSSQTLLAEYAARGPLSGPKHITNVRPATSFLVARGPYFADPLNNEFYETQLNELNEIYANN